MTFYRQKLIQNSKQIYSHFFFYFFLKTLQKSLKLFFSLIYNLYYLFVRNIDI